GAGSACSAHDSLCRRPHSRYLLQRRRGPSLPVVKPSQIGVASLIDVVHPTLDKDRPLRRPKRRGIAAEWSGNRRAQAGLITDVGNISILKLSSLRQARRKQIDPCSLAEVEIILCLATGQKK